MEKSPLRFIVLLGIVSLLADIAYEGARSITGPFLATLGASATVVGIVAGLGELVGYGFRLVSGYLTDRTGRYWLVAIIGYVINLSAVPLLALASTWPVASGLVVAERFGKAIRNPPRDAMLSYAAKQVGRGRGFGIHHGLDQIGAFAGPLVIMAVFFFGGSYATGFALLGIPAVIAVGVLLFSRNRYPQPQHMESSVGVDDAPIAGVFWLFLSAASLVAFGFVDFALISYHFHKANVVPIVWIPAFYALAMATSGLSSFLVGRWFDVYGLSVLVYATLVATFFVPLVFLGGFYLSALGMMLWGMGMGCQTTIMSTIVAEITATGKRGTAYGILYIAFGLSWFLGSALMGYLYDVSLPLLIACSMLPQLAGTPLFVLARKSVTSH